MSKRILITEDQPMISERKSSVASGTFAKRLRNEGKTTNWGIDIFHELPEESLNSAISDMSFLGKIIEAPKLLFFCR